MANIMDGINSVSSISAQIDKLKSSSSSGSGASDSTPDPKELEAIIEQNFNQMLTSLLSTAEEEDDNKSSSNDFLASLVQNTNASTSLTGSAQKTIAALQNDPAALQAYLFNSQSGLSSL